MIGRIQHPVYTAAALTAANPVLLKGEVVYESDTRKRKLGDGVTAWNSLPYESAGAITTDSLVVECGQPDTSNFTRVDDSVLRLTHANGLLIVEFFTTGNGPSPSRAVWRNKLPARAIDWLNSVYRYGYDSGVVIPNFGATGIASKTLSVNILKISASNNSIELYMEGMNSASTYPLPFNFRTVCSLNT